MSNPFADRKPIYSGPGKSGLCLCGHLWEDHHLSMAMRQEYVDVVKEGYLPGECLRYGCNETGGMRYDRSVHMYVDHCFGYRDAEGAVKDIIGIPLERWTQLDRTAQRIATRHLDEMPFDFTEWPRWRRVLFLPVGWWKQYRQARKRHNWLYAFVVMCQWSWLLNPVTTQAHPKGTYVR